MAQTQRAATRPNADPRRQPSRHPQAGQFTRPITHGSKAKPAQPGRTVADAMREQTGRAVPGPGGEPFHSTDGGPTHG